MKILYWLNLVKPGKTYSSWDKKWHTLSPILVVNCIQWLHTITCLFSKYIQVVHFCPYFQIFCSFSTFLCPFSEKSHPCPSRISPVHLSWYIYSLSFFLFINLTTKIVCFFLFDVNVFVGDVHLMFKTIVHSIKHANFQLDMVYSAGFICKRTDNRGRIYVSVLIYIYINKTALLGILMPPDKRSFSQIQWSSKNLQYNCILNMTWHEAPHLKNKPPPLKSEAPFLEKYVWRS